MVADERQTDMLFLALTRPSFARGVPIEGMVLNIFLSWNAYFVWGHANPTTFRGISSLFVFPVLHFTMRVLTSRDHNMFRIIRLYLETHGFQPRGVSILWAMDHRTPKKARGMSSNV